MNVSPKRLYPPTFNYTVSKLQLMNTCLENLKTYNFRNAENNFVKFNL